MKFEYLIGIIIFLVYVVWKVFKGALSGSKASGKGIMGGEWKAKLDGFLSKAQQELKASRQETLKKITGWEEILPSEDEEPKSIRQRISPAPKIKPAPAKAVAESMKPTVSEKKYLPKDSVYGTQDLRKAVIWSEILAPPLALRDEHHRGQVSV